MLMLGDIMSMNEEKIKILEEMVEFVDDNAVPQDSWFKKSFTTEEFGGELSCCEWWNKKKEQLSRYK